MNGTLPSSPRDRAWRVFKPANGSCHNRGGGAFSYEFSGASADGTPDKGFEGMFGFIDVMEIHPPHEIPLRLVHDSHLIVATIGEGSSLGVVMGPDHGQARPVAVANPIFVDVDGDGFAAHGDLLGLPIPHQEKPTQRRHVHRHAHPHGHDND